MEILSSSDLDAVAWFVKLPRQRKKEEGEKGDMDKSRHQKYSHGNGKRNRIVKTVLS